MITNCVSSNDRRDDPSLWAVQPTRRAGPVLRRTSTPLAAVLKWAFSRDMVSGWVFKGLKLFELWWFWCVSVKISSFFLYLWYSCWWCRIFHFWWWVFKVSLQIEIYIFEAVNWNVYFCCYLMKISNEIQWWISS